MFVETDALQHLLDKESSSHDDVAQRFSVLLDDMEAGRCILLSHPGALAAAVDAVARRRDRPPDPARVEALSSALEFVAVHPDVHRCARHLHAELSFLGASLSQCASLAVIHSRGVRTVFSNDSVFSVVGLDTV